MRQSQMEAFQGFKKESVSESHERRGGLGSGPEMMTDDMRREAERERWEAQARQESLDF